MTRSQEITSSKAPQGVGPEPADCSVGATPAPNPERSVEVRKASRRSLRDVRGHKTNRFFEVGLFDGVEQVATVGYVSETWWASTNHIETKTSGVIFCGNAAAAFALARLA